MDNIRYIHIQKHKSCTNKGYMYIEQSVVTNLRKGPALNFFDQKCSADWCLDDMILCFETIFISLWKYYNGPCGSLRDTIVGVETIIKCYIHNL
jgi:hypothetical protein